MNHVLATLIICLPMFGTCLNDEPRMEESRVASIQNYRAPQQQCRTQRVPVEYEERIPTIQEVPNDGQCQQPVGSALLVGGTVSAGGGGLISSGNSNLMTIILGELIGGMAACYQVDGHMQPASKTVFVMQTVKHTRYEQQEQCEPVNEVPREVANHKMTFSYKG